jgi:hypothetical protein
MQAETSSTDERSRVNGAGEALAEYIKRGGAFALLGILLVLTFAMLAHNGIFGIVETFSDEHDHFKRSVMFAAIVRGNMTLEAIGTFYAGGIWPPLYPILIGGIQAATNLGVGSLRVVNVLLAYAGLAFLIAAIPSSRARYAGAVIVGLFSVGTHYYYQIRPENLVLLLLGVTIFLIVRKDLFSATAPARHGRLYALCGALGALACLTHAFLAVLAIYLLLLASLAIRQRFWFVVAFAVVAGPYVASQALIHNGVVLFATTAEENLARNNNGFLRNHSRPEADDLLFEEMERRYKAGDKVTYPRPLVLPQARYEQWLHDENKRRIFKEIATDEVLADPWSAGIRALRRIADLVSGEGCVPSHRYGCNLSQRVDLWAFYCLELLALIGLIYAAKSERLRVTSFSFVLACIALLAPMVATQAVERQFVIVLMLGAFGGLAHLKPLRI